MTAPIILSGCGAFLDLPSDRPHLRTMHRSSIGRSHADLLRPSFAFRPLARTAFSTWRQVMNRLKSCGPVPEVFPLAPSASVCCLAHGIGSPRGGTTPSPPTRSEPAHLAVAPRQQANGEERMDPAMHGHPKNWSCPHGRFGCPPC